MLRFVVGNFWQLMVLNYMVIDEIKGRSAKCIIVCTLAFILGCSPEIERNKNVEALLGLYAKHSNDAKKLRDDTADEGIQSLTVQGKCSEALVSANLYHASLQRVVDLVVSQSGCELAHPGIVIGGRVSIVLKDRPVADALSLLLRDEGLGAELQGIQLVISRLEGRVADLIPDYNDMRAALATPTPSTKNSEAQANLAEHSGETDSGYKQHDTPKKGASDAWDNWGKDAISAPSIRKVSTKSIEREVELEYIDAAQALSLLNGYSSPSSKGGTTSGETSAAASFFDEDTSSDTSNSTSLNSSISQNSSNSLSTVLPSGVSVLVHVAKNSLLLSGGLEDVNRITQTLRKIDSPAPHVLIEGLVVEYSTDDLEALDSQISGLNGGRWSNVGADFGSILNPNASFTNTAGSRNAFAFSAAISVLIAQDRAKIISRPYLATLSRQPAKVDISRNRFVVTDQPENGATVASTDAVTAGVLMNITPTVYGRGRIKMELSVEDSDFIPTDQNIAVEVDKNSASTTMEVNNGESIVIGGLLRQRESSTNSGLPFLRHIPILNGIFGAQESEITKREVAIFITPRVWQPGLDIPLPGMDILRVDYKPLEKHGR